MPKISHVLSNGSVMLGPGYRPLTSDNFFTQRDLSHPAQEWETFYKDNRHIIPSYEGSLEQLRSMYNNAKKYSKSRDGLISDALDVKDVEVPRKDARTSLTLRVYKPRLEGAAISSLPALIYMHGGGWTVGNLDGDDDVCRSACNSCKTVIISVDYALAPESPYPAAINDVWEALNWVISHSNELGISSSRIILGGSSAGANLAAVVTRKAVTHGISICGNLLQIPVVCHRDHYPSEYELSSMDQNKDSPMLSKTALDQFWSYYNPPDKSNIQVSPLLAEDFTPLPPTFLQICGLDPLRDEGLAYAKKLRDCGVPCTAVLYPGYPHGFSAFSQLPAARLYREDMLVGLKALISGTVAQL